VLVHMPPSAQALRYAGAVLVWHAAYRHRPAGILFGHVLVVLGWSYGLLRRLSRDRPSSPNAGLVVPYIT
jgi:hypothetical protein